MKRVLLCIMILLIAMISPAKAQDAIAEVIKQGIKKVIVAVDLKIQRLQTKTIWLQNVQKVIENTMSKLRLGQITSWVDRQKDLYKNYFDELWKVKAIFSYYHRVKELTQQQVALVKEYSKAWKGVKQDKHFTAKEVLYMGKVYAGIIDQSLKNLDQVAPIITSLKTKMTDARRMDIINHAADAMQTNLNDLRAFNQQNFLLSLQRSKDENDVAVVKQIYGLNK